MKGSIIWKSILSAFILLWAITSLFPLRDAEFPQYVNAQVEADAESEAARESLLEEWERLDERIRQAVEAGEYSSYFIALKRIANQEQIDLQRFFAGINARDIRQLTQRNDIIVQELLKDSKGRLRPGLDLQGGVSFTFTIAEEDLPDGSLERQETLEKARTIIAERVDGLGVAEPVIRLVGDNRIEVQMPGLSLKENPDVAETLGKPALLEFSLVHRTARPPQPVPVGYKPMELEITDDEGNLLTRTLYVKRIPEMTGAQVESARPVTDQYGRFEVAINFTSEGGERFADITRRIWQEDQQTGQRGLFAIILDDKLYSAPGLTDGPITGGRATISGDFTQREAIELSNVLNNPLEVGLSLDEMYEVGPSLAEDAQVASIEAAIAGAILVVLFMLVYYQLAGLIATVSVTSAILILLGSLASFGATLTLPGVAAIVLTIGMAVDANILIFERIREERKAGKSSRASLLAGYDKALSTILDANVTTLITALILLWLGTGPVKGFGLTLAIGIFASVFCALVVSRFLLELAEVGKLGNAAYKMNLFRVEGVEFLKYARPAFLASWAIVLIGIVAVGIRGGEVLGIDFTGGDELTLAYQQPVDPTVIENTIEDRGLGEANVVSRSIPGVENETLYKVQVESGMGEETFPLLTEAFPEAGFELIGQTQVGASVGGDVTRSAIISITVALLGMLGYIAFRFEFGYGIGAVVATLHDILMTIGLFVLAGFAGFTSGQFSAPMVAAILMVVGYSINDTIVVFDRIREELQLNPGMSLRKVVHLAINRTLSRTILTSVTTLLATISLLIFGAGVIADFAGVFFFGILTGTFSSIFIASPVFYWWHKGDRKHVEERHDIRPKYDWESGSAASRPRATPKGAETPAG